MTDFQPYLLSTFHARIYIKKSAGNAPYLIPFSVDRAVINEKYEGTLFTPQPLQFVRAVSQKP